MSVDNLFSKADEAFNKKNYAYALNCYEQILSAKPDEANALRKMRLAAQKNNEAQGAPGSFGAKMVYMKMQALKVAKKWDKILAGCVDALKKYPDDANFLLLIGQAAVESKYHRLGAEALEAAAGLGLGKGADDVFVQLAKLYDELGELRKAQGFIEQARKANPTNHEAHKYSKQISAKISMEEGRWEEAAEKEKGGYRVVLADKNNAAEMEVDSQIVRTTEDADNALAVAEKELAQNPKDVKVMRKVADLYMRKKDLKSAEAMLERALQVAPSDYQTSEKLGDLKLAKYEKNLEICVVKYKKDPKNPDMVENYKKAKLGLLKFKVVEWKRRVDAHPTDMKLRLQYGENLLNANRVDDAIEQFQNSIKDPKTKLQSTVLMGQCFMKKKLFDAAINKFQAVVDETFNMNNTKKEAIYCLADAHELAGRKDEALKTFQIVYEADIRFKDVSKRIDRLTAK